MEQEVTQSDNVSEKLNGLSVVISGTFSRVSRDELKELVLKHGGKLLSAVSANTDFLVAGEKMGPAKLDKATKLGVKIVTEEEFLTMIE